MLPPELLKAIFGALTRADLEALMLVNATFCDIVRRDFTKEPLRYITQLSVYDGHDYEFIFNRICERKTREYTYCYNSEEFGRRMQFARVGEARLLPSVLGEELFNILLPHREAWRNGHIETPRKLFATPLLFERAYSELLLCKSMHIFALEQSVKRPFLSFPTVRECPDLDISRAPRKLTVTEVIEWLNAGSPSSEPRRLRVKSDTCDFVVTDLLQELKANFAESNAAYYLIDYILGSEPYAGDPADSIVNVARSERLDIGFLPQDTFRTIRAERKSIEAKQ